MPDPNMVPSMPQPAPSNVVPGPGASMAPSPEYRNPFTNYGPVAGEIIIDLPQQWLETQNPSAPSRDQTPGPASGGETPAQPLYALSIAPVPVEPIRRVDSQSKQQLTRPKQNRIWAVQVAALAENKLAQAVVEQLREAGYDAYVMTTQDERKTWYRVRVGQFDNHKDAIEERKALIANKQFQRAYVALN
jgi:cell division septation protein DedD